ncbi:MAG: hypothetical protein WD939_07050 [Dehalococcoidia bacterium]
MPRFQFDRESRTPSSEVYIIFADDAEIGRADLHYGEDVASATLCVPENFSEDDIQELIAEVDERLVMTAKPYREDFVATVWLGRQAGVYSEEIEEEFEEDVEGNGHLD